MELAYLAHFCPKPARRCSRTYMYAVLRCSLLNQTALKYASPEISGKLDSMIGSSYA